MCNNRKAETVKPNSFQGDNAKRNKHVLITGGNQGIGLHTALLLAAKGGYDVTLACRNGERAETAVRQIREKAPEGGIQVGWLPLDLASLQSVQALVQRVKREGMFFDVLVLNAGVLLPKEGTETENGLEPTFQVNFLGHFLLCQAILAHQQQARPLRVVTLTSVLHRLVGPVFPVEKEAAHWKDMFGKARRWKAYALSKFATALLAQHLNGLGQQVSAVTVHPGAVRTQMADAVGNPRARKCLFFLKRIMIQPEEAAQNVLYCIEQPFAQGQYRNGNKTCKLPSAVCKQRNVDNLVQMAKQLTADFQC